jgi:hypothetical protein
VGSGTLVAPGIVVPDICSSAAGGPVPSIAALP